MSHHFDTPRSSLLQNLFIAITTLCLTTGTGWCDDPTPEQLEFFEKKIRPILSDHCYECHAAEKQESDLRLDSRRALIMGGASGKAVNLEDPESSLILEVLNYGGDIEMPPDQKLSDEQINDVKKWIEMGVPWPKQKKDADTDPFPVTMADRVEIHRQQHWAYQAVKRPMMNSKDLDKGWSRNSIDRLIGSKLTKAGLKPSAEADRYTLTRRLYLGLIGIPPTFDEAQRVIQDPSPTWYEDLVDRLLASPRYGERWGRHWMDVARYADTRGYSFQRDRNYPHAYTYRDYVIDSLNDDKPYDRFIKEQLAADQLDLGDDLRPLAALGFLTVGRKFNNIHDDVDDKIDVVFRGLQGLTVACARCHDHKYDAIPTADYYSLYGVFVSSREGDLPYIGRRDEVEAFKKQKVEFDQVQKKLDDFLRQQTNSIAHQARMNSAAYFAKLIEGNSARIDQLGFVQLKSGDLVPKIERAWREYVRNKAKIDHPVWAPWKALTSLGNRSSFSQDALAIIKRWETDQKKINPLLLAEFKSHPPTKPVEIAKVYGKVFTDVYLAWKKAGSNDRGLARLSEAQRQIGIALFTDRTPTVITKQSVPAYLNDQGREQHQALKKQVDEARQRLPQELDRAMVVKDIDRPVTPVVFIRGQAGRRGKKVPRQFVEILSGENRKPFAKGSGRLELANLITSPANPLTARVIANRVWMHLMGESIVETPSDFGQRCPEPTQSDVLDLLASELIDHQWSIKRLQRLIVLSATYRQVSDHREDGFQADAGNTLYWRANRQRLEFEPLRDSMLFAADELDLAMNGKSVHLTKRPFQKRRGVYGYVDRQDLPNLFRAFDFASPDQSAAKRTRTTVPQQMLFMMNSPFVIERAFQIASRIPADLPPAKKVEELYKVVFARRPSEQEQKISLNFVLHQKGNDQRFRNLAQLLLLTNEFTFVD